MRKPNVSLMNEFILHLIDVNEWNQNAFHGLCCIDGGGHWWTNYVFLNCPLQVSTKLEHCSRPDLIIIMLLFSYIIVHDHNWIQWHEYASQHQVI